MSPSDTPLNREIASHSGGKASVGIESEVSREGVRRQAPLFTGDHDLADLDGRHPIDQMIGDRPVRECADDGDEVFVRPICAGRDPRCDRGVDGTGYPCRQIEVMSGEVLDDSDIADPSRKRPLSFCSHLVDVSERVRRESRLQGPHSGVVPLDVTNAPDKSCSGECIDQAVTCRGVYCERLFHEAVHSGGSQLQCYRLVHVGRCRHDAEIEVGRDEVVHVAHDLDARCDPVDVARRVCHCDEIDVGHASQDAYMLPPHHSESDDSRTQVARHYDNAASTASMTVSTDRSER